MKLILKLKKIKKKQNYRQISEKHTLSEDNILYLKKLNKENNIDLYIIPYEVEKNSLFEKYHNQKGHLYSRRVFNEIRADKIYWKTMRNDIINYINKCPTCIRKKGDVIMKANPGKIIPNGPKDRYVIDGWKIHKSLATESGYSWVIDIIDYFSKFMMSYAVPNNDSIHTIQCIKQFCLMIGNQNIIQTDNGSEYKNSLCHDFCLNKNINHIFISPNYPQSNGVIEVAHKVIRHNVMIYYSENPLNFDLKNAILEAVDIHNNKIHTITKYKPIELR